MTFGERMLYASYLCIALGAMASGGFVKFGQAIFAGM